MVRTPWKLELCSLGAVAPPLMRQLREDLASALRHPVWISSDSMDIASAFDPRRRQYNAIRILEKLLNSGISEDTLRLGITTADLFLPVFTHVFGTAQLNGQAAVASLHRLRPEFIGEPANPTLLRRRILVESIHETGHLLGLVHCHVSWCAMAPSRLPEHIELKDPAFCPECSQKAGLPVFEFILKGVIE